MQVLTFAFSFLLFQKAISYKVIPVPIEVPTLMGDGGRWDDATKSLLFVDRLDPNAKICRYDYNLNHVFCANIRGEEGIKSGFLLAVEGVENRYLVGLGRKAKLVSWNGKSKYANVVKTVFSLDANASGEIGRGRCDADGRLFFGTTSSKFCGSSEDNSFNLYTPGSGVKALATGVKTTSGLVFFVEKANYVMDGCKYKIDEFYFDSNTDTLNYGSAAFTFDLSHNFLPFGLDADANNNLFTSIYGASEVWKISPDSTVSEKYRMPVPTVTAAIFCGPNLDEICVTSSSYLLDINTGKYKNKQKIPMGGWLFRIVGTGSVGFPDVRVRLIKLLTK